MSVRSWPVAGVAFGVLWVFVRGSTLEPTTLLGQFLGGLAVGLPIAFLFRRLYVDRIDLGRLLGVSPAVAGYLAAFGWELVRANVDVAYRVLSPGMPIEPDVILVPLRVESAAAVTVIANSITITPGTVTLDHDGDANALYVHVIDGRAPADVAAPIRSWEDYALEIFDERRSPTDPEPDIVTGREAEDRARERGVEPESERRSSDDE
ncbi:Na+/H+ antiporter subunit E [Natronococcus sp. JC468]|uniref:Na+/H+ antiporter subunit E n=1 Tax=Natronococcus sp. JC468 TaxID=1961921 RepID=UPI001439A83D|nr:Na+/H+ antiporter subunit E [Natronococcus sp. JC468]NKE34756.1 Na+/H+ antiporter subunit E [Natronococcus sp. JC468]